MYTTSNIQQYCTTLTCTSTGKCYKPTLADSRLTLCFTHRKLCILYTIREFGALLFATIMTTRQFLSILLSCIIFMHPLTLMQWLGTGLVFVSLYYQAFVKSAAKKEDAKAEEVLPTNGATGDAKAA